ncbi:MAG: BON domain-containing protein [Armatimonadota bacterium]
MNGYETCPVCGCPHHGQRMGPGWGMQRYQQPMGGYGYAPPYYGPEPAPIPPYAPAYYGGLPTDSEIEEMIYDAIDADPLVPFDANIDVSVDSGTVYLRGEVMSKRIKHAAGDDAWWIPGVIDVHNEMKVTPRRRERQEQTQA